METRAWTYQNSIQATLFRRNYMSAVFVWMALGLGLTGGVATGILSVPVIREVMQGHRELFVTLFFIDRKTFSLPEHRNRIGICRFEWNYVGGSVLFIHRRIRGSRILCFCGHFCPDGDIWIVDFPGCDPYGKYPKIYSDRHPDDFSF